jgi:threonine dehydratase
LATLASAGSSSIIGVRDEAAYTGYNDGSRGFRLPRRSGDGVKLDIDRVIAASNGINRTFVNTPQYRSEALSRLIGVDVILKIETVNPVGSAAGRSIDWWMSSRRSMPHRVVCASDGDFALAMAWSCRARGVEFDAFAPMNADAAKLEALRRGGATVRLEGRDVDEARVEAQRYAEVVDARYVEDGREIEFVEGAATIAAELEGLDREPDTVYVPLDRGTLALATGLFCHQRMRRARVVGVGPEGALAMVRSVRERRMVVAPEANTIASALAIRVPIEELVQPLSDAVDDTATVTDDQINQAIRALAYHEGLRVAPSGAAALAAAAIAAPSMQGATVVVPVTSRTVG